MKRVRWFLILLILLITAVWYWQARHAQDGWATAWQQAQFRTPQISREAVMAEFNQRRQRQRSVPQTFQPEIGPALEAEFAAWQRQFEKGDADRQTRLSWQQLTETTLKQTMRSDLKEEAWLEHQLQIQAAPITEEQARAWYTQHMEEMRIPQLHRVSHLFLSRHDPQKPNRAAEIQALSDKLGTSPASFTDLVAKHSEDSRTKTHGGDLGWVSAARLPSDFMQATEKLAIGEISKPIETKLGWHILRVTARRPSRLPTFDEMRDEITVLLDQQRREKFMFFHSRN